MISWEILAIQRQEDSEYDDCRAIEKVGYKVAGSLKESKVDEVALKIDSGLSGYHIKHDGQEIDVQPIIDGPKKYVRSADEDTPADPLLDLPSIAAWRTERRFNF